MGQQQTEVNVALPGPFKTLDVLKSKFLDVDLNTTDLVALSGNSCILINQLGLLVRFDGK